MRTYLILQMYIHISHQCHVRQDTGHTPCSAAVCVRRHTHVWTYETLTEYTAVWPRLDDSHWADMWGPCHYSHADIQPCNEHTHRYICVCVCCRWSWWSAHPATFALPSCFAVWLMSDEVARVAALAAPCHMFLPSGGEEGWRCKDLT